VVALNSFRLIVCIQEVFFEACTVAYPTSQAEVLGALIKSVRRVVGADRVKLALAIVYAELEPPDDGREHCGDLSMGEHHGWTASTAETKRVAGQGTRGFRTVQVAFGIEDMWIHKTRRV
jgi:hypothetical protein